MAEKNKTDKTPMISVIIPIYNVAKYLPQCLSSIIWQTYGDLEIICVDDGSPDNSIDILKDFAGRDGRIKIIRQKNGGISSARNAGLGIAAGEYIHFFDPDDYIPLDYYEKMLGAALSVDADMAAGGIIFSNGEKNIIYTDKMVLTSIKRKSVVTKCTRYGGFVWRYLFRRDFIEKNGLRFAEGRLIEDVPFTLAAVEAANCIAIAPDAPYYYMQDNQSSISSSKGKSHREKMRRDRAWAYAIRDEFIRRHNLEGINERKIVGEVLLFGMIPIITVKATYGRKYVYLFGRLLILKTIAYSRPGI